MAPMRPHGNGHADPTLLRGALQPAPHESLDPTTSDRDQAKEPEEIGENTGSDQQRTRQQDDHAVHEGGRREASGRRLGTSRTQHAEPLAPGQRRAQNTGRHDQGQRSGRADPLADLDEKCQLDRGNQDEQ